MKTRLSILSIIIFFAGNIIAQEIAVKKIQQLTSVSDGLFLHPQLHPDGEKVFFTKANFQGIYKITINDLSRVTVTDKDGAGYNFCISEDGQTIYYRSNVYFGYKKQTSLLSQNLITGRKGNYCQKPTKSLFSETTVKRSSCLYR